jgi:tripartite-type tricarboxylate transporter receptor subunit TctC
VLYASTGVGTAPHLSGELLTQRAGVKLVHVPYQGSPQAATDLLAGRVTMMFSPISAVIAQVEAGKLKALASATSKRPAIAPDVPTMAEAGLPGYDLGLWFGLMAPAGTPQAIVDKLNTIANDALKSPDVVEPLHKIGMEIIGGTSADFARYIDSEVKKATDVATAANIRQ